MSERVGGGGGVWGCRLRLAAALVYCLCGRESVDVLCGWHLGQHERGLLMDVQRLLLVRQMERVMLVFFRLFVECNAVV